jgi:hypothetical protein
MNLTGICFGPEICSPCSLCLRGEIVFGAFVTTEARKHRDTEEPSGPAAGRDAQGLSNQLEQYGRQ